MTFIVLSYRIVRRMLPIKDGDTWYEDPDLPLGDAGARLGNATGTAVLDSDYMRAAAMNDPIVADYAERPPWIRLSYLFSAGDDFFAIGCGGRAR